MGGPTAGGDADKALGSLDLRPSWPAMNGSRMNMFTPPRAGVRDFALWACAHSRIFADWYGILHGFQRCGLSAWKCRIGQTANCVHDGRDDVIRFNEEV